MMSKVFLCDVDEVVARLHDEWLRRYNDEWGDNLSAEKVTGWSIHRFVKPECGHRIYKYLKDEDLYDYVEPVEGALESVEVLRACGYRVVFVTSANEVAVGSKMRWLVEHGFLPQSHSVRERLRDFIAARDKSLISGMAILDDAPHNIESSRTPVRILYDAPWNRGENGPEGVFYMRAFGWDDVLDFMLGQ